MLRNGRSRAPAKVVTFAAWAAGLLLPAACRRSSAAERVALERVFITNEDSGTVSVIDAATDRVERTITVGRRPRGLHVSHDGSRLFVALSGSPKALGKTPQGEADRDADGIGVVNLRRGTLDRKLSSGRDPESFDLSADDRLLYVSNEETSEATLVDIGAARILHRSSVGSEPEGVAVHPDGHVVYVTSEGDSRVDVLDARNGDVVAQVRTGSRPRAIAFSPDGRRAFVTNELGGTVTVVDAEEHLPQTTIDLSHDGEATRARPMGIVLSPDSRRAYVTTGRAGGVAVLDTTTNEVSAVITDVGPRPWGIAVTRDGGKLYVANGPSNDVAVIDTASLQVVRRIAVGGSPWGACATAMEAR